MKGIVSFQPYTHTGRKRARTFMFFFTFLHILRFSGKPSEAVCGKPGPGCEQRWPQGNVQEEVPCHWRQGTLAFKEK